MRKYEQPKQSYIIRPEDVYAYSKTSGNLYLVEIHANQDIHILIMAKGSKEAIQTYINSIPEWKEHLKVVPFNSSKNNYTASATLMRPALMKHNLLNPTIFEAKNKKFYSLSWVH